MRVEWLRAAMRDLDAETTRLAQEDPEQGARTYDRVRSRVEELAQFAHAGRPGRVSGTRELVFTELPYIVPYRVRDDVVQVLRVFHTSRKPPVSW